MLALLAIFGVFALAHDQLAQAIRIGARGQVEADWRERDVSFVQHAVHVRVRLGVGGVVMEAIAHAPNVGKGDPLRTGGPVNAAARQSGDFPQRFHRRFKRHVQLECVHLVRRVVLDQLLAEAARECRRDAEIYVNEGE